MPEERSSPSAGWRAVYAAMGAAADAEDDGPRERVPGERRPGRGAATVPSSASRSDGAVVGLDDWRARADDEADGSETEAETGTGTGTEAGTDVDAGTRVGRDRAADVDPGERRRGRADASRPLRGEAP